MRLDPDAMIDIARLVESGKLRVPVGEVLALEDIERACDLLRDPAVFGKIVVRRVRGVAGREANDKICTVHTTT